LDFKPPLQLNVWTYKVETPEPDKVERAFQKAIKDMKFEIIKIKTDKVLRRFICKFSTRRRIDKDDFHAKVLEGCEDKNLIIHNDWQQQIKKL
jgi:hypothetical protein